MLQFLKKRWWKVLAVILLLYSFVAGFLMPVPRLPILHESIRNLYFHVPMWFTMVFLLLVSVVQSIRYLTASRHNQIRDMLSVTFIQVGLLFGLLGLFTGMIWANYTWGDWWVNDPRLNGVAVALLIYVAYFILRGSISDEIVRARVSSVYSIFAFVLFIIFIFIIPRMTDSLHPGVGGNPAFSQYDLDNRMRLVFYPAVAGWIFFGLWLAALTFRANMLEYKSRL